MDERLWAEALAGDEASFTTLLDRYEQQVYVFFRRRRVSADQSEDLAQQTFLTLLETGNRFESRKGPFRAYLFGIVRNIWLKHLEKSRRLSPDVTSAVKQPLTPAQQAEQRELEEALSEAMKKLPEQAREILAMRISLQLPVGDIAAHLGMPMGTVKSHLHRARRQLRAMLCNEVDLKKRGGS